MSSQLHGFVSYSRLDSFPPKLYQLKTGCLEACHYVLIRNYVKGNEEGMWWGSVDRVHVYLIEKDLLHLPPLN